MKVSIYNILRSCAVVSAAFGLLQSCNKELPEATPITTPAPSGSSIAEIVNSDANFTILKAAIARAVPATAANLPLLSATLADKTAVFTVFAPDDAAFIASGIPSAAAIGTLRTGFVDTVLRYHLIGGIRLTAANISTTFPNMYLQSTLFLQQPSAALPPGLRMPIFPSKRGTTAWVNNIPVIQADISAANGVIHKVASLVAPPSQFLWDRVNTDADLTYLKAAIAKADEGTAPASTLTAALQNPAANLTVFAPTNAAFQQILTALITQALIQQGSDPVTAAATATALASTPGVFTNPALAAVLTPTTVKGIVVYHLFGNRAFSVNMPTTATSYPTLLNSAIPTHPGVAITATFGPTGVTAATIKGAANATASTILINPTPAPGGTSDQHYINGALHKINQVLLPQ